MSSKPVRALVDTSESVSLETFIVARHTMLVSLKTQQVSETCVITDLFSQIGIHMQIQAIDKAVAVLSGGGSTVTAAGVTSFVLVCLPACIVRTHFRLLCALHSAHQSSRPRVTHWNRLSSQPCMQALKVLSRCHNVNRYTDH
jgi:hypothetical protein